MTILVGMLTLLAAALGAVLIIAGIYAAVRFPSVGDEKAEIRFGNVLSIHTHMGALTLIFTGIVLLLFSLLLLFQSVWLPNG